MKKLMTMLAAAAMAFGLFADGEPYTQSADFETVGWTVTGNWSTNGEATVTQGDWGDYTRQDADTLPYGFDTVGSAYLTLKSAVKVNEGLAWANADTDKAIGAGIYFDGLVNFTHCEDPVEVTADNGTKLVVYTVESEIDPDDSNTATKTNLYVSAGFKNGNAWEAKAYDCGSLDNFNAEQCDGTGFWRVTIRSIRDISEGADVNPGFLVFVNGVGANRGDQGIGLDDLNGTANAWATKGNLFPSLVQDQMDQSALTAINEVAFAGQGSIDDVVITRNEPADFVKDEFFTLTIGEHVASISYTVNSGAAQQLTSGSAVIPYVAGMQVAVTATYEAGDDPAYGRGDWKLNGVTISGTTFAPSQANQTGVVNGKDVTARIMVDGVGYPTFADAIAALATAETKTLTLNKNITVGYNSEYEVTDAFIDAGDGEVVLDLAGKTLTGANVAGNFVVIGSGNLKIVDSSELKTGKIVAGEDDAGAVRIQSNDSVKAATLTIEAGTFDGAVVILTGMQDLADAKASISGGSFKSEDQGFYLKDYIADGFESEYAEGYWTVKAKTPATVALTLSNATVSGVVNGDEVFEGDVITFTAAPAQYYENVVVTINGETIHPQEDTYTYTVVAADIGKSIAISATASATEFTVKYYDSGDIEGEALLTNTFTVANYTGLTLWDGTREGYTFDGEWQDADYTPVKSTQELINAIAAKITAEAEDLSVELSGTWTPEVTDYTITFAEVQNGTLETSVTNGIAAGTTVTVIATPVSADYECTQITTNGAAITGTSFAMPAENVLVGATFTKKAQPIDPGTEIPYDSPSMATNAASVINANKETNIRVPDVVPTEGKQAYLNRVAAKVVESSVVVDIAADKEATFKTELDTEMKKDTVAAALTDASATTASITTVAGFYYWVEGGVEVGTINQNGAAKIGTGSTIELAKPALGTTDKAFYKLAVGVKDPAK